jgi:hypothetical protein
MVAIDNGLHCIPEIAKQVPSVRNLNGIRRPLANAISISSGAIARDDLNAGILAQPVGDCLGLPVRQ